MGTTSSSSGASQYSNLTRMAGLASGLDTENLVKAMASSAKTRYNRKAQKLQTLQWKQEAYRKQITALSSFQDKYLNLGTKTSIKQYSNLSKYKATASDSRVTATVSAGAKEATYTITKTTTASKAAVQGDKGVIDNAIMMDFNKFSNIEGNFTAASNAFDAADAALRAATDKRAALSEGIEDEDLQAMSDEDYKAYMEKIAKADAELESAQTAYKDTFNAKSIAENENEFGKFITLKVTLNGTEKDITFNGKTKEEAISSFNDAINTAFNGTADRGFKLDSDTGKLTYNDSTSDITHTFSIKYNEYMGISNDSYSKVNTDATLGSIAFANGLQASRTVTTKYTAENYKFDEDKDSFNVSDENKIDVPEGFESLVNAPGDKVTNYYDMEIGGKTFSFTDSTSIQEMLNTVNNANLGVTMSYSTYTQSFKLETNTTGANQSITAGNTTKEGTENNNTTDVYAWQRVENDEDTATKYVTVITGKSEEVVHNNGNLYNALFGADDKIAKTEGRDSTITMLDENGDEVTYTNATNSYTFDGTTINVANLNNFDAQGVKEDYITISTKKDTSQIKDLIVNFINDYNTLIDGVYKEFTTSRPKEKGSYFDPLTDEQEEEMEKDEIEKWNEKAKQGLLYQDGYMSNLYNSLVSAMGSAVDGVTLADMGIKSTKWSDNGKLSIDEDKLDEFLSNNSDKAINFFTKTSEGMAYKVDNAINKAISSTGNVGYLTGVAGREGTATVKKNSLYTEITSLQKLVDTLKSKYESEMERYWKKFTALETYMNNMNSQAAMFLSE